MTTQQPVQVKNEQGDIYFGIVVNGKPHGQGTLESKDGNVYEGMFEEGKRHG